ncbi:MAG: hypothetical protein J6Y35_06105 [Bacteroidales bacterium]|nr:hypothetical protein [Bacteroidales bacterium]
MSIIVSLEFNEQYQEWHHNTGNSKPNTNGYQTVVDRIDSDFADIIKYNCRVAMRAGNLPSMSFEFVETIADATIRILKTFNCSVTDKPNDLNPLMVQKNGEAYIEYKNRKTLDVPFQ